MFSIFGRRKKINLDKIRLIWSGQPKLISDEKSIPLYHHLISKQDSSDFINDTTWTDLNLDSFLNQINRCISPIGSQNLFHILHTYESDAVLKQRSGLYDIFLRDKKIREQIQLLLLKLSHRNTAWLSNLFLRDLPPKPKWAFAVYWLSLFSFLFPALIYFYPLMLLPAMGILILNLIINQLYGSRVLKYFVDISNLSALLKTGLSLADISTKHQVPQLKTVQRLRPAATSVLKKIGWLTIDKTQLHDFSAFIVEYLNHFSLFELASYFRSIDHIRENREKLKQIYESVGSLDALISVSAYLNQIDIYCEPQFGGAKTLRFKNVYHPLLKNAVSNSIDLNQKSVLITGSNMAGKTTFVKTVAVNLILAQTLNICFAKKAELPRLKVHTSIKRSDDINQQKSYYYQEIEAVLRFIELNEEPWRHLFIIDEIFRGTNTIERISAATSVLEHLGNKNYTLVTTHDIELQDLLKGRFDMYHFNEQVSNGQHFFDYILKPGASSERNAIELLKIKGYPQSIVDRAKQVANTISTENLPSIG